MSMMRVAEMNKYMVSRGHQGMPHNTGIKTQAKIEEAGREIKNNPPKILAHTAKKFGKARAKRQKTAIMLAKAREEGAKIPLKKS